MSPVPPVHRSTWLTAGVKSDGSLGTGLAECQEVQSRLSVSVGGPGYQVWEALMSGVTKLRNAGTGGFGSTGTVGSKVGANSPGLGRLGSGVTGLGTTPARG